MLKPPVTLGDLLVADVELARLYEECRAKHRALSEVFE